MPEGLRYFLNNDKKEAVSSNEADAYLKANPQAQEFAMFNIGGNRSAIAMNELPAFFKANPNAKPYNQDDATYYLSRINDQALSAFNQLNELAQTPGKVNKAPEPVKPNDDGFLFTPGSAVPIGGASNIETLRTNLTPNDVTNFVTGLGKGARSMGTEALTYLTDIAQGASPYGDVGQADVVKHLEDKAKEYAPKETDPQAELFGRQAFIPVALASQIVGGAFSGGSTWSTIPATLSTALTIGMTAQAGYSGKSEYNRIMQELGKEPDPKVADLVGLAAAGITYGAFQIGFGKFLPKATQKIDGLGKEIGTELGKYFAENPTTAASVVQQMATKPNALKWISNFALNNALQPAAAMGAMDLGDRLIKLGYAGSNPTAETELRDFITGTGSAIAEGAALGIGLGGVKLASGYGKLKLDESNTGFVDVARDKNGDVYRLNKFSPTDQTFTGFDKYGELKTIDRNDVSSIYRFTNDQFKYFKSGKASEGEINLDAEINSVPLRAKQYVESMQFDSPQEKATAEQEYANSLYEQIKQKYATETPVVEQKQIEYNVQSDVDQIAHGNGKIYKATAEGQTDKVYYIVSGDVEGKNAADPPIFYDPATKERFIGNPDTFLIEEISPDKNQFAQEVTAQKIAQAQQQVQFNGKTGTVSDVNGQKTFVDSETGASELLTPEDVIQPVEAAQPAYPVLEDGSPDFDNMTPEQLVVELPKVIGPEETVTTLQQIKASHEKQIETLQRKYEKETSINKKIAIKNEIKTVTDKVNSIGTSISSLIQQPEVATEVPTVAENTTTVPEEVQTQPVNEINTQEGITSSRHQENDSQPLTPQSNETEQAALQAPETTQETGVATEEAAQEKSGQDNIGPDVVPVDPVTEEVLSQQPNIQPTEAEKKAGNYKKAHIKVQGMDITIENPKGSIRSGTDEDGRAWETEMMSNYGYFTRTTGSDGDHIDTFVGENPESTSVFVVDQVNPNTGDFDESKVMLGFNTPEEAKAAYLSNYEPDWKGFGSITPVSVEDFKSWLYDGARQRKPFAEYKSTPEPIQENKIQSWIDKFEELKALGDPKELDMFYTKVRVALNGYAQGKNVVNEFEELKKQIEDYAVEFKNNKPIPDSQIENTPSVTPSVTPSNTPVEQVQSADLQPEVGKSPVTGGEGVKAIELKPQKAKKKWPIAKAIKEAKAIEPTSPYEETLMFFIDGGKIGMSVVEELYGGRKGASVERKNILGEWNSRISYRSNKGLGINEIAHYLWQSSQFKDKDGYPLYDSMDYREAVEDIVNSFTHPVQMAKELLKRHDLTTDDADIQRELEEEREYEESINEYYQLIDEAGLIPSVEIINSIFAEYEQEVIADGISGRDSVSNSGNDVENRQDGEANQNGDIGIPEKEVRETKEPVSSVAGQAIGGLTSSQLDAIKSLEEGQRVFVSEEITEKTIELLSAQDVIDSANAGFDNYEVSDDETIDAITWGNMITKDSNGETVQVKDKTSVEPKFIGEVIKPYEKIEDFGEKIEGAKKDEARKYYNRINLNGLTLSTIFPKPDIKKLIASGLSKREASAVKVAYEFAQYEKKHQKVKERQLGAMRFCAAYAKSVLAENLNIQFTNEGWYFTDYGKKSLELRVSAYEKVADELGVEYINLDLSKVRINELSESDTKWRLERLGAEDKFEVQYYVNSRKYFKTLDEALTEFVTQVKDNTKVGTIEYKRKLNVYSDLKTGTYYIAYQPSGKPVIKLKEGFKTTKEAFDYRASNVDDLQTMLDRIMTEQKGENKKTSVRLKYSNETSRERVGKDWRDGKNVNSESFAKQFGFRGVEYGNWVNQGERQAFLNNAYDSLMDLAQLLGISPRAISLNGKIAVSFGSRGTGNAAAHFEPERLLINLTKTQGLGALAHEWFHAVDNYFAGFRISAKNMKSAVSGEFAEDTRPEIRKAFNDISEALKGEYQNRSQILDMGKNKNYYSLTHEMAARAFENYILNKTKQSGQVNDFLSNYVSPDDWRGQTNEYPYPIGEESNKIAEAFDNLFNTIEEKDNSALFSIIGEKGAQNIEGLVDYLNVAKEMEAAGKDASTIFLATGWEKFPDGWKYDVVDDVKIINMDAETLGEAIQNTTLFDTYPELKNVRIGVLAVDENEDSEGQLLNNKVDGPTIFAMAQSEPELESILVHEIQHAIQDIEGFASGGNIEMFRNKSFLTPEDIIRTREVVDALTNAFDIASKNNTTIQKVVETISNAYSPRSRVIIENIVNNSTDSQIKELIRDNIRMTLSPEESYKRLAGEVEARNVQTRMNLSPEARKQVLISQTQDVAEDQKIYIQNAISQAYSIEPTFVDSIMAAMSDGYSVTVAKDNSELLNKLIESGAAQETVDKVAETFKSSKVEAFYLTQQRTVYLNGQHIKSNDQTYAAIIHESIHGALADTMGGYRRHFGQFIYNNTPKEAISGLITEAYDDVPEWLQGEEYITHMAAQMSYDGINLDDVLTNREINDVLNGDTPFDSTFVPKLINTLVNQLYNGRRSNNPIRGLVTGRISDSLPTYSLTTQEGAGTDQSGQQAVGRNGDNDNGIQFAGELLTPEKLPLTIDIDGVQRPTTNSNGKPIATTEEGVRNFWKWFGDSKVVDEQGRPLVVYHGTDKSFTKINMRKGSQGLFWVASNKSAIEAGEVGASGKGKIMELYAKIDNPADWNQYEKLMLFQFKNEGLDGAVLPDPDGSMVAFVFSPTQIKSATGNNGNFDPEDSRINYSKQLYHGSPHSFDKFDLSKVGTGEGAQAFGYGLYFTSEEKIAKYYAEIVLDPKSIDNKVINDIAAQELKDANGDKDAAIKSLTELLNESWSDKKRVKAAIKVLETGKNLKIPPKNLYVATIHSGKEPSEYDYLRWDKEASDSQIDKIESNGLDLVADIENKYDIEQNEIGWYQVVDSRNGYKYSIPYPEKSGAEQYIKNEINEAFSSGEKLYQLLSKKLGTDKAASEFLLRAGIDGIEYPAIGGTGGKDGDAMNYVVFDDKAITIDNHLQYSKTQFASDVLFSKVPESVNPEVDKQMKAAHGLTLPTMLQKIKDTFSEISAMTHHFEFLREGEYPAVYDMLRRFEAVPDASRKFAYEYIKDVINPIKSDKALFEAFERNVVVSDLYADIKRNLYDGKDLPWGYNSKDEVLQDLKNLNQFANENPALLEALMKRKAMMKRITTQLVEFGIIGKDSLKNEDYFHHQVIEYMNVGGVGVTSKDARLHKKGWQNARTGSMKAYNTNYFEAEYTQLAQAVSQIEAKQILNQISEEINIAPTLIAAAEISGNNWRDSIPEGYKAWYPKVGTKPFIAASYAERIIAKAIENNLDADALAEATAEANENIWVIPEIVGKQLDSMRDFQKEVLPARVMRWINSKWKQWILINPYRVLKYNLNNLSGDIDIVLASRPGILKPQFAQTAALELWENFRGGNMSEDIQACIRHGVISSGISIQEIPDIQKEGVFKSLSEKTNYANPLAVAKKLWSSLQDFTEFRESMLRVAAYKYFKAKLDSGKTEYSASKKKSIDAIKSNEEKAAKLARELLGDYGNLSQAGQWMRSHIYPFWSWVEINTPRYYRLLKNTRWEEGKGSVVGSIAARTGFNVAKLGLKAALLMAIVTLWNKLRFPDEEEELRNYDDRRFKLILGRDEDGEIRTLRVSGAFADMLSWVGIEDVQSDVEDVTSGDKTMKEKLGESGKAFLNKSLQGVVPIGKSIAEATLGKSYYPDVTQPTNIRSSGEHLARMVSMDKLYRWLNKMPLKSLGSEMSNLLIYKTDPGEAAYYAMRQKVFDFNAQYSDEKQGGVPTDRANALYYYKQSLKYGDEKLASYWMEQYKSLGGKTSGIKNSIKNGEVLNTVVKGKRIEFKNSLSDEELKVLEIANEWYDNTYRK